MQSLSRRVLANTLTHRNVYHLYLHEYQAYDLLKKYQVPLVPVSLPLSRASGPTPPRMRLQSPSG
jgi:hypothetical protein